MPIGVRIGVPSHSGRRADSLRRREEGQTMAEYGVVLAMIGAITLLSDNVRSAIESVANLLP
jgi:Flp pilus assembly pilin Flp